MRLSVRLPLVVAVLALFPLNLSRSEASFAFHPLTRAERTEVASAASLARGGVGRAIRWLRSRRDVAEVRLSPDGVTIEIEFRDRALAAVFPPMHRMPSRALRLVPATRARPRDAGQTAGTAVGKAIVLEPFATSLGLGETAGSVERNALTRAGFHVDVYRDGDVTVPVLETLGQYSVVYMETHSGVCGPPLCSQGDAFVLTGETNPDAYGKLFADRSLVQGFPQGDASQLYVGFTSSFIRKHVTSFPDSTIVFMNGCSILVGPAFVPALQAQNVASTLTWDEEVQSGAAEAAADFMFPRLANGETVGAAFQEAAAAGLTSGPGLHGPATLHAIGDQIATFPKALAGATPTATPTSTPTPTPTATPGKSSTPPASSAHAGACSKTGHRTYSRCWPCKSRRCTWHASRNRAGR